MTFLPKRLLIEILYIWLDFSTRIIFFQYTRRLMDESTWEANAEGIALIYGYCDVRNIYNSRVPVLSSEFREVVELLPDQCAE